MLPTGIQLVVQSIPDAKPQAKEAPAKAMHSFKITRELSPHKRIPMLDMSIIEKDNRRIGKGFMREDNGIRIPLAMANARKNIA